MRLRKSSVLLAEDNLDDIEITRRALNRMHLVCELIVTRDGEAALALLLSPLEVLPDVVLLDINLPKLNGLQVLSRLRMEPRLAGLPIVVMSASSRDEDIRQSYQLGANTYIQKQVVFEDFLTSLEIFGRYWFGVAQLQRRP